MKFKWRKWNRIIHRDFGYFFFGMTMIYALSGIAINHLKDWNPNYVIVDESIFLDSEANIKDLDKDKVLEILDIYELADDYKKHYYPSNRNMLKIFIRGGSVSLDLDTNSGVIEKIRKRHIFNQANFLHYNPNRWWTWFSDIYTIGLITLAITGLFILKGKKGITGRGAWLTTIGVLLPILFLIIFR